MKNWPAFFAIFLLGVPAFVVIYRSHNRLTARGKSTPETFHYFLTATDSTEKGYFLLTPYRLGRWKDGQLLVMDHTGRIRYQENVEGAPFCFRQWIFGGRKYYTYLVDDKRVYHIPGISLAAGAAVLLDSTLHPLRRFGLVPHNGVNENGKEGVDLHDLILLDTGHYVLSGVVEREVGNIPDSLHPAHGLKLAVPVLQEVNRGKVVWQWMASDYPCFYAASIRGNNFSDLKAKHDYLHINSIAIDPADSNIIVSLRHADQVVKIERNTGKVLWKLGGRNSDFKLLADQVFYKQHSAVMAKGGELLLFDNGDRISREKSRIVWFRLDEKHRTVAGFRSFVPDQAFSMYMGSAEVVGDTLYLSGGSGNYVMEYDLRTGKKIFGFHSDMAQYRVYRALDISGLPERMDQACVRVSADTLKCHLNK